MNHERSHVRSTTTISPATDPDIAPGRAARTDQLFGPGGVRPSGLLMRKAARDGNGVEADAEAAVGAAASSSGRGLPDDLRAKFESSLGTDLGGVRVHTSAESAAAASAVGAKAYTLGNDIHFGAGHFDASSSDGQHLLAHEVAHTVQQRGGSPTRQNKLEVSSAGDHFEREADHAASAMVTGAPTSVGMAGGGIARAEEKPDEREASAKIGDTEVKLAQHSLEVGNEAVKLSLDWEKGVKGSMAFSGKEVELFKKTINEPIVTLYKVLSISAIGDIAITAKPSGVVAASGTFEKGKGGTITLEGGIQGGIEAVAKLVVGPSASVPEVASLYAGLSVTGSVAAAASLMAFGSVTLAGDGSVTGSSIGVKGDATGDVMSKVGAEIGSIVEEKSKKLSSIDFYAQKLGDFKANVTVAASAGTITESHSAEWHQSVLDTHAVPQAKKLDMSAFKKAGDKLNAQLNARREANDDKENRAADDEQHQSCDQQRSDLPLPNPESTEFVPFA